MGRRDETTSLPILGIGLWLRYFTSLKFINIQDSAQIFETYQFQKRKKVWSSNNKHKTNDVAVDFSLNPTHNSRSLCVGENQNLINQIFDFLGSQ